MKKSLLILFVLGISLSISSIAIAGEVTDPLCDGYSDSALDLCNAYCAATDCDLTPDDQKCKSIKKNFTKQTGEAWFPCSVIACAHQFLLEFQGPLHIPTPQLCHRAAQPDHIPLFPGRRWPGYYGPGQNQHEV